VREAPAGRPRAPPGAPAPGRPRPTPSPPGPSRRAKSGRRRVGQSDAVTVGDAALGYAVREGLLRPIPDARRARWWALLGPRWRELVTRDPRTGLPDPRGEVFAAPYRWGCAVVAFNADLLRQAGGREVRDWGDLLQPALRGRVAFVDSGRDLLTAALGASGLGPNAVARGADLARVRDAAARLRGQVRVASSEDHVRSFAARDSAAVVGWSSDVVPAAQRMSDAVVVVPASGTTLWADLWAVPAWADGGDLLAGPSPLLPLLLEYGLQPTRATARASGGGLARGASPLLLPGGSPGDASPPTAPGVAPGLGEAVLGADWDALRRSEFLLPLDAAAAETYAAVLRGQ